MNRNEIRIIFLKELYIYIKLCVGVSTARVSVRQSAPARSVADVSHLHDCYITNCDFGQSKQELLKPVEQENKSTKRNKTHERTFLVTSARLKNGCCRR